MAKYLALLCVFILTVSFVMACNPPGMLCTTDDECCGRLVCHQWAKRCTGGPQQPPADNDQGPPAHVDQQGNA